MEVNSTVKEDKKSLQRTFSVVEQKMERKPSKTFGSHEAIATKSDKTRRSLPLSRRASADKPVGLLPKKPFVNSVAKKTEKGTATEGKAPKMDITRRPVRQRSEIVAAVTQRLYNKVKRKEVATETEQIETDEPPQELKICSNARLRLQEITRKVLRAHRRRDKDTQTDLFPVMRVKEAATDADDLRVVTVQVKHAQTEPRLETKDVGTGCSFPVQGKAFVITRSCSTQAAQEEREVQKPSTVNPISFTKYLHQSQMEPKYQLMNPCHGSPIYTSSVNINVSHNYTDSAKPSAAAGDSLEEDQQGVCFPTPDLISNHNSLDAHEQVDDQRINYAQTEVLGDQYSTHQTTAEAGPNVCVASCTFAPRCSENVGSIEMPSVRAPEICVARSFEDR